MKKCPKCAEQIQDDAIVCRYCGYQYTPEEVAALAHDKSRNRAIGAIAALGLIGACVWSLSGKSDQTSLASDTVPTIDAAALDPAPPADTSPAPEVSRWYQSSSIDELRQKPIHLASITSENSASFDSPYDGDNRLRITIRKHPEWGTDVMFRIDRGQILCRSYSEPCRGKISFDGKIETLTLVESADNDSAVVFANYAGPIINKIKAAETVVVELPFYQEGNVQFTFKTKGLDWPPSKQPPG